MTQEDKDLLLRDLCARLPYGVKIKVEGHDGIETIYDISTFAPNPYFSTESWYSVYCKDIKPYLRPMSSMTKEEKLHVELTYGFFYHDGVLDNVHIFEVGATYDRDGNYEPPCEYREERHVTIEQVLDFIHWLNAHHFDYRGLIKKGLALEALEGMYNVNEK